MTIIEGLRPEPYVEVTVPVHPDFMDGDAREFRTECLDPIIRPHDEHGFSDRDLDLMAGAFLTLLNRLPTGDRLLLDWLVTKGHVDDDVVAEYARDHFGMEMAKAQAA